MINAEQKSIASHPWLEASLANVLLAMAIGFIYPKSTFLAMPYALAIGLIVLPIALYKQIKPSIASTVADRRRFLFKSLLIQILIVLLIVSSGLTTTVWTSTGKIVLALGYIGIGVWEIVGIGIYVLPWSVRSKFIVYFLNVFFVILFLLPLVLYSILGPMVADPLLIAM